MLGAGAWARGAHLPGYRRDSRCRVVAIADAHVEIAVDPVEMEQVQLFERDALAALRAFDELPHVIG